MPFKLQKQGRQRKSPAEIVGVDLGGTGLKAVRMRQVKDAISVIAADILPPLQLPDGPEDHNVRLKLPKALQTNYVAIAVSGQNSVVRLLNLQGHVEPQALDEAAVREHVGLAPEYRISHVVLPTVRGKQETKVLVVGFPEKEAKTILSLVPSGPPAPYSVEVAGLSALTAFMNGPAQSSEHEAMAVIESGAHITFMALFHKKSLALVRKFDFGAESFVERVQQQLGVDRETARGIIADGSFDISQPVHEVMDPFLRQLTISKDFVERREDCHVGAVYLSGGTTLSRYWTDEVKAAVGVDVVSWDPFEGLHMADGVYPAAFEGQRSRFAAAVGACMGVFRGS